MKKSKLLKKSGNREELQSVNEELITVNQKLKINIEELSLANADFQNLMNSTAIGTVFLDRSLHIKMFTPTVKEIFNLIDADLNRPLADIATKFSFGDLTDDVGRVLDTLQTVEREVEAHRGKWYQMRVLPYRTAENHINGVVITFVDITRRRKSEEDLAQSEKQFRAIVDQAAAGIGETDLAGKFLFVNDRYCEMLGYSREELLELRIKDITHPDDFSRNAELLGKLYADGAPFSIEKRYVGKNGETVWVCNYVSIVTGTDDRPLSGLVISLDITQRKQSEERLREVAEQLARQSRIFDTTLSGITDFAYIFDRDARFIYSNQPLLDLLGITAEEIVGKNFLDLNYPDELAARLQKQIQRVFDTRENVRDETPFTSPAGETGFYEYILTPVLAHDGTVEFVAGSTRDISERKQAAETLRESEERLRLLVESASDYAIFTMMPDGRINSWNAGAEKVFGWTESEALGQSYEIIFTPEDCEAGAPEQEIETALRTGRSPDERFHLRRNGSRFFASGVMMRLKDADGNVQGFAKIARDMTERIEAEKAVRDKEMLQRIVGAQEDERKRIARDLHDELGQQLTALRMKLDSVRKMCDDDELRGRIDETQLIAKSLDDGVDFLAWELRPSALDDLGLVAALGNYVKQWSRHSGVAAELLASSLKRARFTPEIETNLYRIVQEALNNTHKHAKAKSVEVMLEKRDEMIVLLVEDDGRGFNPEDKKNRRKGIGLIGMKERAALVGGSLEIESVPGRGTTVFVRVPVSSVKKRNSNDK